MWLNSMSLPSISLSWYLSPDAHSTAGEDICQLILGEGGVFLLYSLSLWNFIASLAREINAAASMSALTTSKYFDPTTTYS